MSQPDYRLGRHRGKYVVVWHDQDGRRQRRSLGTHDRQAAETALGDFIAHHIRNTTSRITVGLIAERYLADRETEVGDPQRLRHAWMALNPHFTNLLPEHIDKRCVVDYAATRSSSGRQPGTIRRELTTLRAALRWAEKTKLIDRAPHIWLPRPPAPKDRWLTDVEVGKLIIACAKPHLKLFVQLALGTGARTGAILELTWDRVSFDDGLIDFRLSSKAGSNKRRTAVKMNPQIRQILIAAHKGAISEFVIEWGSKQVRSIKKGFANAVVAAGIPHCTPHTLRHTAAIKMARARIPMAEIAAQLGHTDSRTTERVYAKYHPDHLIDAANSLQW